MRAKRHKGTVGVVGLGIMGGAFARNLVADGWRVIGHDIDRARMRALARAGIETKQLAFRSDQNLVVIRERPMAVCHKRG